MSLQTKHLARCIDTLERSLERLRRVEAGTIDYEIYRNAVVKGFELALETAGNLLRKTLKAYVGNPRTIDELTYKDVFRHSTRHRLLEPQVVERWSAYRDNRNSTAHDYGEGFAEETLRLMPAFLADPRQLEITLREQLGHASP